MALAASVLALACAIPVQATARQFVETDELPGLTAEFSEFGTSCTIDGNWLFAGSPQYSGQRGGGYFYRHDGSTWTRTQLITPPGAMPGDFFGWSASLHRETLVVGAPLSDPAPALDGGTAVVFRRSASNWAFEERIQASDRTSFDRFGTAVAVENDRVVAGAPNDDDVATDAGAAYVFRFDGSSWLEEQKLLPSQAQAGLEFGESVAIDSDVIAIGAQRQDVGAASEAGAVYLYRLVGSAWVEEQVLVASDPTDEAGFGSHVRMDRNVLFVGAQRDSETALRAGAVYVFRYDGSTWNEEQKIVASDGAALTFFGERLDVQGDLAVIAATNDHESGIRAGSAYSFAYDGMQWIETQKFTAADTMADDAFGLGLSLSNHRVAIAAPYHDKNGRLDVGSLYVFEAPWVVRDCQGVDRAEVLFVNQENAVSQDFTVAVDPTGPIVFSIEKPMGGGNGKFVVHLNAGDPTDLTLVQLPASLGIACFQFLLPQGGAPVAIWNSIGKENKIGGNEYFGVATANPGRAPTIFLELPSGDATNLPVGSTWTLQGVILNPAASSPKGASVTNAVRMLVE